MTVEEKVMTAEAFWELYGTHDQMTEGLRLNYELINGERVDVPVPGGLHAEIQALLIAQLVTFVLARQIGKVYGEAHFKLAPNTLRVPDVAFVHKDKLGRIVDPHAFIPFAPDLAVEIVSPTNTATEMQQRVNLYLAAGTSLVWVIYPELRLVVVHNKQGTLPPFSADMLLEGGDLLLGLSIPVVSLFPPEMGSA